MNLGIKDFQLTAWKCNRGLQQTCMTFARAVAAELRAEPAGARQPGPEHELGLAGCPVIFAGSG